MYVKCAFRVMDVYMCVCRVRVCICMLLSLSVCDRRNSTNSENVNRAIIYMIFFFLHLASLNAIWNAKMFSNANAPSVRKGLQIIHPH